MLGNKPPYTTMQQLNLDWILSKLKTLLRLVPDDGAVGQILRRTREGAVWSDEQGGGGGGAVESVNGQTGAVVLDASDVGALPDDYTPPVTSVNGQTGAVVVAIPVQSVNGQTGAVVLDADDVGALPDDYTPPVTSVNGQTGAVVVAVPVQSVNGQTGTVVLDADDVGALPDDYTPPVTSVNGQTGAVVIPTPEWEQIGTATGSTAISISNQYKTFSIDAQYGTSSVFFPLSVTYSQLGSTAKLFTVGYYINASTNGFCQFSISDSQVSILALYINGVNYTSTATLRVFGQ